MANGIFYMFMRGLRNNFGVHSFITINMLNPEIYIYIPKVDVQYVCMQNRFAKWKHVFQKNGDNAKEKFRMACLIYKTKKVTIMGYVLCMT